MAFNNSFISYLKGAKVVRTYFIIMRDEIQLNAVKAIKDNKHVLIEFGTGLGKSKVALDASSGKITLLVYKQTPHLKNWLDEINKWNIDSSKFYFTTYNSLHKHTDTKFDVVILDEAHAITDKRLQVLKQIDYDKGIYLSATVPYEKKLLLSQLGKYKLIKFSLQDAIDSEMLPEPKIFIHEYHLDDKNVTQLYERVRKADKQVLTINYAERFNYLSRKGVGLRIQCTEKQYYELLCNDIDFWKQKYFQLKAQNDYKFGGVARNLWLNKASQRKQWTNNLKTNKAIQILNTFNNRVIVFSSTIEQCNLLAEDYKKDYPRVHSKMKDNQSVVDAFNNGYIDRLYNCSILNEGMNLKQLDACLITGIDGKELSTVQRIGRSMRSQEPEIHIIKAVGTKDGENVDKILEQYKKVTYVF